MAIPLLSGSRDIEDLSLTKRTKRNKRNRKKTRVGTVTATNSIHGCIFSHSAASRKLRSSALFDAVGDVLLFGDEYDGKNICTLRVGERLGPYEILAFIGAGV